MLPFNLGPNAQTFHTNVSNVITVTNFCFFYSFATSEEKYREAALKLDKIWLLC